MGGIVQLVGKNHALQIFGVTMVGVNAQNGRKLLFTLVFILLVVLLGRALRAISGLFLADRRNERVVFWVRQAVSIITVLVLIVGLLSIWFDDPTRLATHWV